MAIPDNFDDKHFIYSDYKSWDDTERWELIDGRAYCMSPAPNRIHQKVLGNMYYYIKNYLLDKSCEIYASPFDVRLPKGREGDDEVDTVIQPDLVVVCDQDKLDDAGMRGAPDLTLEVLSPSTSARDNIEKLRLYEKHGVKEYWIVHPTDKIVWVYTLLDNGEYGRPDIYDDHSTIPVGVLPGLEIDMSRVF